jgi:PKD repeat protein
VSYHVDHRRLVRRVTSAGAVAALLVIGGLAPSAIKADVASPAVADGPPQPPVNDSTAPVAVLDVSPKASGGAPFDVTADGSGSTDNVEVTSYTFNWGDGTEASGPEPESIATHRYARPGEYTITMRVSDSRRNVSTATRTVTVTAESTDPPGDQPPSAAVRVSRTSHASALSAQIDASGSTDDLGIDRYRFDFGDGEATDFQPSAFVSHVYRRPGTYTMTLTVRDTGGQKTTATTSVTVPLTRAARAADAPTTPSGAADEVTIANAAAVTPRTTVAFTFDDTFANQVGAADVLARYGMKGTFYLNSPRIGSSNSQYMSRAQVNTLVSQGHEIAGHTLGHVDLATATSTEARRQICDDRTAMVNMGYRVTSFAYPFGSTNADVKRIVQGCGYTNARGVGDLRSPGYGCLSCATADTVPPADRWKIKTNASVKSDTTVSMLQTYVTQAENDQGGLVPLVFHSICSGCASNAMSLSNFTAFVDWLSKRPSSTQVRTMDQVINGTTPTSSPTATATPTPTGTATATPTPTSTPSTPARSVTVGSATRTLNGTNIYRSSDYLVLYTPARGATTRTNAYGTEVAVVNGAVTKVETSVGNMAIPSNGYVLSGHGTSNTWLRTYAKVGTPVRLNY